MARVRVSKRYVSQRASHFHQQQQQQHTLCCSFIFSSFPYFARLPVPSSNNNGKNEGKIK
jgi:hypothetical protein